MRCVNDMNKKYLITGVSAADPYTNIFIVPSIKTINKDDYGAEKVNTYTNIDDERISREVKSSIAFADGPMLNILRKYIRNGSPITDIYIYLTKKMASQKDLYKKAIESLYCDVSINPTIVFYPHDFYKDDYDSHLRDKDVHNFASYYREINEIYSHILAEQTDKKKPKIILNITSGTPAFEADMMIMAVTNNLTIEQTSMYTENEATFEYIKNNEAALYNDILGKLNDLICTDSYYQDAECEIQMNLISRTISNFSLENIDRQLEFLHQTEKGQESRSKKESIREIKKIMLLESVEDSIDKKDYCGAYYSIIANQSYLIDTKLKVTENQQHILEIAKNLYYRYIGNNEKALDQNGKNDFVKLKEYYPIYNIPKGNNCSAAFLEEFNALIEKANIMKIKSQREEMNDWLLISTALLEAIEHQVVTKLLNYNLENLLDWQRDSNGKKAKNIISLKKLNNAPDEIKNNYYHTIKESAGNYLNSFLYKNILEKMKEYTNDNIEKKKQLESIICDIDIVDLARSLRVAAAHSVENISKQEFLKLYKEKIEKKDSLRKVTTSYFSDNQNRSIQCVEDAIKRLLKCLLPDTDEVMLEYFEKSTNIYTSLEKELLKCLKNEIYNNEN